MENDKLEEYLQQAWNDLNSYQSWVSLGISHWMAALELTENYCQTPPVINPFEVAPGNKLFFDFWIQESIGKPSSSYWALGFEVLLKGIYLHRKQEGKLLPSKKVNKKTEYQIPEVFQKHSISKLWKETLTEYEIPETHHSTLEVLSEIIKWRGRYPLPKDTKNNFPGTVVGPSVKLIEDRIKIVLSVLAKMELNQITKERMTHFRQSLDTYVGRINAGEAYDVPMC